jgi:hypothetical protein
MLGMDAADRVGMATCMPAGRMPCMSHMSQPPLLAAGPKATCRSPARRLSVLLRPPPTCARTPHAHRHALGPRRMRRRPMPPSPPIAMPQRHHVASSPALCKAFGGAPEEVVTRAMNSGMSKNHALRSALIGWVCRLLHTHAHGDPAPRTPSAIVSLPVHSNTTAWILPALRWCMWPPGLRLLLLPTHSCRRQYQPPCPHNRQAGL